MSGDPVMREAIRARITALQVAQRDLEEHPADALAAIRRIAKALKNSDISRAHEAIAKSAAAVLRARRGDIVQKHTSALVEALHLAADQGGPVARKVLLVDDDRLLGAMMRDSLTEGGFEVLVAETLGKARAALEAHNVSLAILDLILPDGDGRSLLMSIRESPRTAALPVFIMTGKSGAQAMTECFALGADEFFEKPVNPEALAKAVGDRLTRTGTDVAAQHDSVTGALTRAALLSTYEQLRDTHDGAIALALVAVDDLAETLGTLGGPAIEEALKEMALLLRNLLPLSASTGRWSGSELVCIAPRVAEAEIAVLVQRALDARRPDQGPGFSAGITSVEGRLTLDDLVTQAAAHLATARLIGGGKAIWSGAEVQAPPRCVLFVEDDDVISSLVSHRLRRDGFDVVHAGDGVSALRELVDKRFTLAILETRTPGLDGFSVLERMRSNAETKRTPVIMLSSMGNEQDVVKCFQLGADDYMLKPFSPVELLARVHRLLARA